MSTVIRKQQDQRKKNAAVPQPLLVLFLCFPRWEPGCQQTKIKAKGERLCACPLQSK